MAQAAFTIVPKELIVEQTSISTILRHEHRGIQLKDLPDAIFLRNNLSGTLDVTHSRTYGAADKTRAGQPKEGWRLVFLTGCPEFMRSLSMFPETHRFTLGSSGIQLWGGVRKKDQRPDKRPGKTTRPGGGNNNNKSRESDKNNNNSGNRASKRVRPSSGEFERREEDDGTNRQEGSGGKGTTADGRPGHHPRTQKPP